ncbi:PRD domain-containing protein [Alkalibaculum sp. M08DMB]|uniref:PRD domain-containing protein n=1 Tax=Alkalibaculum sporogenes TaxID=2655001 RepID=A0A6A7K8H3_9FIRM|nr:sigma-54-dependent transcriptional regulator [Alkalibaculum sporogenes]MPW25621.1 PRD domain-containing protein [Alkalibaculum sporogenes]
MKRKQKVFNALKSLCESITIMDIRNGIQGITTENISDITQISRNNVSFELNTLIGEKKVIKIVGRPVYYFEKTQLESIISKKINKTSFDSIDELIVDTQKIKETENDLFEQMIGCYGSLQNHIKKLKAAVIYPPNGLHTMLVGPTGVGKSTFAELMYKYALVNKVIAEEGKLIVFNCAEYSENPQLLMSQLFGYMKGAFTGADSDKQGLIDKANGGFLFLDEIHRLSPEGQEMLFTLIDKNLYRRLGEVELHRIAKVRIIGATTKKIDSSLLSTFIRRIPIVINLPSLIERTQNERMDLIKQFIYNESIRINADIRVDRQVIESLLLYDCIGNIGQLKSDIQLVCARGYLDYKVQNRDSVEISIPLLPDYIYEGYFRSKKRSESVKLDTENQEALLFSKEHGVLFEGLDDKYNISKKVYKIINEKLASYSIEGCSPEVINKIIDKDIHKYLWDLEQKFNIKYYTIQKEEIFKVIEPVIYYAVENALRKAEEILEKNFNNKAYIALSMHVSELIKKIEDKRYNNIEDRKEILTNYPQEYKAAQMIKQDLERDLHIQIVEEEIIFITMFLYAMNKENNYDHSKITILIICHGENTASSIAKVANSLLGTNICYSLDMPLDMKVGEAFQQAVDIVKSINQGKGVLLMVDMGALTTFSTFITEKTGIQTATIEMVSTPLVLEAVRKCLFSECDLNVLCNDLKTITPYRERKKECKREFQQCVLVTCITGIGTAKKIISFIKQNSELLDQNIMYIPLNEREYLSKMEYYKNNAVAVIGTLDLKIENVPYIPTDEIIEENGVKRLESILGLQEYNNKEITQLTDSDIIHILGVTLVFLNPQKIYNALKTRYYSILNELNSVDNDKLKTKFFIHCSCMVERLIKNESIYYQNTNQKIKEYIKLYNILCFNFEEIEEIFGISIPDTEICYIIDLFNTL